MTTVRIIGVSMVLGDSRCGVPMGPSAVRYTDLWEQLARSVGRRGRSPIHRCVRAGRA